MKGKIILRFPTDAEGFNGSYAYWDSLNGRYYIDASVVTDIGQFVPVSFDSKTGMAMQYDGKKLPNFLFGKKIINIKILCIDGKAVDSSRA